MEFPFLQGFQQNPAVVSPLCSTSIPLSVCLRLLCQHPGTDSLHAKCIPCRKQQLHFTSNFSTVTPSVTMGMGLPSFLWFYPHTWNVSGHSDTTLEKSSRKVFLPGVLQAFKRCFCFGLESCEPDVKVLCTSSLPRKGMWFGMWSHPCIPARFCPSGASWLSNPAWSSEVTWIQTLWVTRVHCTNICVGSRPGAVSGVETSQGGLGLVTHPLDCSEVNSTGWQEAVLTFSSPVGFVIVPHLSLLCGPALGVPELHDEPWAGNKAKN